MAEERGAKQRRSQDEDGEGRQQRSSGTRKKTTTGKSRQRSSARTATKRTSSGPRQSDGGERSDGGGQKKQGGQPKGAGSDESTQERERESTGQSQQEPAERGEQASEDQDEQAGQDQQAEQAGQDEQDEQAGQGEQEERDEQEGSGDADDTAEPPRELPAIELVKRGKELLAELTGHRPESVSGLDRHGGGWRLTVEVVELNRIPPSTDVLATYELDLTEAGELAGYRRTDRYLRNQAHQRSE